MTNAVRLNVGAGSVVIDGYTALDIKTGTEAGKLPYADESVDEVYASHVLEHVARAEAFNTLREWVRVLKPGGILRVAVPDMELWAKWVVEGRHDFDMSGIAYGGQVDADDFHRNAFNGPTLAGMFREIGLVNVRKFQPFAPDTSQHEISLNLEGVKPSPIQSVRSRVKGIMTTPRIGFTNNFSSITRTIMELGIPFQTQQGAYWHQGITRALEWAGDAEYILTVDYDTLFTVDDVRRLVQIADANPEYGAIAAMQSKREENVALLCREGQTSREHLRADVLEVKSCHFGLTLIRSAALKAVPKPWFLCQPDPEGGYGDGRIDADVAFWHRLRAAGHKAGVTPHVAVGHLQLMATWPGFDLMPVHQYVSDWDKSGPPERCLAY
jgi:hypothetical protein